MVAADLGEHAAGDGEDPHATASPFDDPEERVLDVARVAADLGRGAVGDDPALAHQQQPVAPLGLVHHVAGDEDDLAGVGEAMEERPQVAAQDGIEADGGLVEDEHVGVAEEGDGEAGARRAGRR